MRVAFASLDRRRVWMCFSAAWLRGLDPSFRRVVPTGGRKPNDRTFATAADAPRKSDAQFVSQNSSWPGRGDGSVVPWLVSWLHVGHLFLEKKRWDHFFCVCVWGGFVV